MENFDNSYLLIIEITWATHILPHEFSRGQIVLDHRDQQHQRQQTLASEVERLKEEIQSLQTKISSNTGAKTATSKWFAAALKPEEKEAKLQSQLTEAQAATEKSRQEYEEVARKLAAEISM